MTATKKKTTTIKLLAAVSKVERQLPMGYPMRETTTFAVYGKGDGCTSIEIPTSGIAGEMVPGKRYLLEVTIREVAKGENISSL